MGNPARFDIYANGQPRGKDLTLDTPEDRAQLVSYDEALAAAYRSPASTRDSGSHWAVTTQAACNWMLILHASLKTDLEAWPTSGSMANEADWNYVEFSPRGGLHAISLGRQFPSNLDDNKTGIEAYSHKRFFTFTGNEAPILPQGRVRHGRPFDLYDYVEQVLYPHWLAGKTSISAFLRGACSHRCLTHNDCCPAICNPLHGPQ